MNPLSTLYRPSLALLTDLYQLTMSYGYWKNGMAERESVFHLFFRKHPFKGGYTLSAGLEHAMAFLENLSFPEEDLAYLAGLKGNDGLPLFEAGFLEYLAEMKFSCDVEAIPEGTVVFPHEPLIRIRGPLVQCQLVETPLLNMVNFQTLVATKAARVCSAAQGDAVLEFGLRRAQGIDGGLSASRAAYLGGCHATSNVLAGKLFGIPVKGTHAHSWVMSFDSELEAFDAYAAAMPNNCVFLVDTYDTLEGVRKAVQVGEKLREKGFEMAGIRLDSGDLAELSKGARRILDENGFPKAQIVASNDLNDHVIADLKEQGAQISVWGVGTKLATCYDQPALGGVYKLGAIRGTDGEWDFKVKLSEQPIKVSNPGLLQVRRYYNGQEPVADLLYNEESGTVSANLVDPNAPDKVREISGYDRFEDLLVPVFRKGRRVYESPELSEVRKRAQASLAALPARFKALSKPDQYPFGLEGELSNLKMRLVEAARSTSQTPSHG